MKGESVEKRFFDKVNKNGPTPTHVSVPGPCWEWTGGLKRGGGYGDFCVDGSRVNGQHRGGRMMRAHRFSWEFHVGKIPEGKDVLHICDNKKCVNFQHLFIGDDADNVKDRVAKGRSAHIRGDANGYAKLTTQNVLDIREAAKRHISTVELARKYNVTYENVWKIVTRRTWNHL